MATPVDKHKALYEKAKSIFATTYPDQYMNQTILSYSCQYYYSNLSRVDIYKQLVESVRDKDLINAILNLIYCMKDETKPCLHAYANYCDALRKALK